MNKKEFREINSLVFLGTFLTHDLHRTDHILNYKQQHIIICDVLPTYKLYKTGYINSVPEVPTYETLPEINRP